MTSHATNPRLDEEIAAYVIESKGWIPLLLVNVVSKIESIENIIARQDESLEAVEQSIADIELDTLEQIADERVAGKRSASVARYANELSRKIEQRRRLRGNSNYAALKESRRGLLRERARLAARLNRLEAYRELLLADVSARQIGRYRS